MLSSTIRKIALATATAPTAKPAALAQMPRWPVKGVGTTLGRHPVYRPTNPSLQYNEPGPSGSIPRNAGCAYLVRNRSMTAPTLPRGLPASSKLPPADGPSTRKVRVGNANSTPISLARSIICKRISSRSLSSVA